MPNAAQGAALARSISQDRLGTYRAAAGGDPARTQALYLWDRDLSVAFLADIAILEVALRNAMNAALTAQWGPEWFKDPAVELDDRSVAQLAKAWGHIRGPKTPGRLVAQCMFGFWVGLLDKGDHFGREPRRTRCYYENNLWRGALSSAFPGGKAEAASVGVRYSREWTHKIALNVNTLRNRVAHHEPLINGFPLSGQQIRWTAQQGHDECLRLARLLDRDLASWLQANSQVPNILVARP